jgi:glycerol-3-phosphate dehydrogenase subunit B
MPAADVVVVGAGLAGLTCAHGLARRGARVVVLAKGHATTHWTAGSIDVAAPPGVTTARAGVGLLARQPGHPYLILRDDVEPAVDALLTLLVSHGLPYEGGLDQPIRTAPTGIGGTRPISILPAAQAAALAPWQDGETLVVCGIRGFKDVWPAAVAASLARRAVWSRQIANGSANGRHGPELAGAAPAHVVAATADLPAIAGRQNLTALHLARAFDDASWRVSAIDAIARAIDGVPSRTSARLALPAVLGLRDHAAVMDALRSRIGLPVFELPLVPPSIPGMRLFDALRRSLRAAGVRLQLGESVSRVEATGRRVELVATPAAVREYAIATGAVVLATGGIAGGGLVAASDGQLEETVLGLPVDAPGRDDWFARDPFDPRGHPLEAAGVTVDADLRPIRRRGKPAYDNVRVIGSLLAGQHWVRERCGDGVAIASAHRAAASLAGERIVRGAALPATADTTSAAIHASAGSQWRRT